MGELTLYNKAKLALAECRKVDEVKTVIDQAEAMRHYATIAKDKQLLADAAEIKDRAQRRMNQLLAEQPLKKAGRPPEKNRDTPTPISPPSLHDQGIDKNLAKRLRVRKHADLSIPEADYEREVIPKLRERITKSAETAKPRTKTYVTSKRTINMHQFAAATCRKLINEVRALTNSKDFKTLHKYRLELEAEDKIEIEERINEAITILSVLKNSLCRGDDPKVIDLKPRRVN